MVLELTFKQMEEVNMDSGQNDYIVKSRDEYIRMARESCLKNLHPENQGGKGDLHKKDNYKSSHINSRTQYVKEEGQGLFQLLGIQSASMKNLLIRLICALVLFLAILMIDKFDVSIKSFNSGSIEQSITSNQGLEKAEDFFVSVYKKIVKEEE